jgi:hypothetical protein
MTIKTKTTMDRINITSIQTPGRQILSYALKVGFFIWHYFEMMLAMGVGAYLFELLVREIPASTSYTLRLWPGTFSYISGISLAMMLVMIAWMVVRGHGWRHSGEMAVAMLLPVALVAVISIQKGNTALFDDNYCSAMCVGMLAAMLFRWEHFTRCSFRSSHHGH